MTMDSDLLPDGGSSVEYAATVTLQKMFALSLAKRIENGKRLDDEAKEFIADALRYYAAHASTKRQRSRGKPPKVSSGEIKFAFELYRHSMSKAQAQQKVAELYDLSDPRSVRRILSGR